MSCINCAPGDFDNTIVTGPCRVCEDLDNDSSLKRVWFCNPCKVYMCETCKDDLLRRTRAFTGEFIRSVAETITGAVNVIKEKVSRRKK